jgi:hypothetical protein
VSYTKLITQDCPICFEIIEDERVTSCKHSFCAACITNLFDQPVSEIGTGPLTENDWSQGHRSCPLCRTTLSTSMVFRASAFLPPEIEDELEDESDNDGVYVKPLRKRSVSHVLMRFQADVIVVGRVRL